MLPSKSIEQRRQKRQAEREANLAALCKPAMTLHKGVYAPVDAVVEAVPKSKPVRSEAYRRLVAAMPCAICGVEGFGQAAHPNAGKGMGTKACDLLCFCLCGPRVGEAGCHSRFDQAALMTKEERRAFEKFAATFTQKLIVSRGLWPANLPRMEGESA
jgi:hypothetical protein